MMSSRRLWPPLLVAVTVLLLGACSAPVAQRGNVPDPELLSEIEPGVYDRNAVSDLLGTPSSIAAFDDKIWYYISKRTEQFAFLDPEVLDQQVVAIIFDDEGYVKKIRHYGPEDGREVVLVEDETPTRGKELTFVRQMLKTIGFLGRDPLNSKPTYDTSSR